MGEEQIRAFIVRLADERSGVQMSLHSYRPKVVSFGSITHAATDRPVGRHERVGDLVVC
jgi:hypothetical protein